MRGNTNMTAPPPVPGDEPAMMMKKKPTPKPQ
jgi:hypothetical protein